MGCGKIPRFKIILLCVAVGIGVNVYQGCSEVLFESKINNREKPFGNQGNGGPYEGKVGTYYRLVPNYACESQAAPLSVIDISSDSVNITTNYKSKCGVIKGPMPLTEFDSRSINGRVIPYRDGLYELHETAPNPAVSNVVQIEAFCQSISNQGGGVEAIVRHNVATQQSEAALYFGSTSGSVNTTIHSNLIRQVNIPAMTYSSADFTLSINTDNFSPGLLNIFQGRLQARTSDATIDQILECRTGYNYDPILIKPAPGTPSANFGVNGKVTFAGPVVGQVNDMALLNNGKMLITMGVFNANGFNISRLDSNGSLDISFNVTGSATVVMPGAVNSKTTIIPLSDGRIILGGESGGDWALARLNEDGSHDLSFGNNGRAILDLGGRDDRISRVLRLADGRLLAVGSTGSSNSVMNLAMARFSSNGQHDLSFGSGGIVNTNLGYSRDAAVSSTDQIFTTVSVNPTGDLDPFGLAIFNNLGTLIRHAVNGSVARTSWANDVEIQSDGKVLVGGRFDSNYGVARYFADGTLDTKFGDNGLASVNAYLSDYLHKLLVQSDGKIVLVGGHSGDGPRIVRIDDDGKRDHDFGGDGMVNPNDNLTDPNSGEFAREPHAGVIASDGKIRFAVEINSGEYSVFELNY